MFSTMLKVAVFPPRPSVTFMTSSARNAASFLFCTASGKKIRVVNRAFPGGVTRTFRCGACVPERSGTIVSRR